MLSRSFTTMILLLSALLGSCSSILHYDEKYANSYKILTFNPFVLKNYNVVVAKTYDGEPVLVLVNLEPPQPYNKNDFTMLEIDRTYRLDLVPIPDTAEFEGIPVPGRDHYSLKYWDLGRFEYKGEMIDYYDSQSMLLLLPSYFTSDLCANNRDIILVRRKPH